MVERISPENVPLPPQAPVNMIAPAIPAAVNTGDTLTVATGTWLGDGITLSYQWQLDGVDISGATGASYIAVAADEGRALTVRETAINAGGSVSAISNACVTSSPNSFDPLGLSPLALYDVQDMSTLWQDEAGTIQVTAAGQTVHRIDDLSGNGHHAVSAGGAVLVQDDFGFYCLRVTDSSEAFKVAVTAPSDWPVLGVAQYCNAEDNGYGLTLRAGNNKLMALNQRNNTGLHVHGGGTARNVSITDIDFGHVTLIADPRAEVVSYNDKTIPHDYRAEPIDAMPAGLTTWEIALGSHDESAPTAGVCSVYSAIVIDGTLPDTDRTDLNTWLESRCPVQRIKQAAVFHLIGQSNMIGKAEDTGASSYPATAFEWTNDKGCVAAAHPLQHTGVDYAESPARMGMQAAFSNRWAADGRGDLIFVASANGGTGFSPNQWGLDGGTYVLAVAEINAFHLLYDTSITAFLWHQGEGDLDAPDTYAAALYDMIGRIRADASGASDAPGAETPFILGQISADIAHAQVPVILAAIDGTPDNVPNTAVTSSAGLTLRDTVHFDEVSLITLGERYYDVFLSLIGEQTDQVEVIDAPDTGLIEIVISQPVEHAGTYTVDAADLAEGAVNLVPPSFTGTPTEGTLVSYVPGIWAYDVDQGPPVLAPEWYQAGTPTGDYGVTRTVSAEDVQIGLSIMETAANAAGTRLKETALIVDPYTEAGVVPTEAALRFDTPLITPNPAGTVLIFVSFIRGDGSGHLHHAGDAEFYFTSGSMRVSDSTGAVWDFESYGASKGDRVNLLCAIDVGRASIKTVVKLNGADAELKVDKEPGRLDVALGENPFAMFADTLGGDQFSGTHFRSAIWTGTELPDIADPYTQLMFWDSAGALRNPAISRINLGQALLDAYGSAAEVTGNTYNKGTRGAFDTVTGTFIDA